MVHRWIVRDNRGAMLVTEISFVCTRSLSSYLLVKKNGRNFGPLSAKRTDLSDNSSTRSKKQSNFSLVSKANLSRTAIAVLGLGFVDAGYSGDWSRIGVLSKEMENLLKVAAFVVVPLCIFLIFSLRNESKA